MRYRIIHLGPTTKAEPAPTPAPSPRVRDNLAEIDLGTYGFVLDTGDYSVSLEVFDPTSGALPCISPTVLKVVLAPASTPATISAEELDAMTEYSASRLEPGGIPLDTTITLVIADELVPPGDYAAFLMAGYPDAQATTS